VNAQRAAAASGVIVLALAVALGAADSLAIGVVHGLSYAAVALGLVLVFKGSGILSLAHGPIAAVGAFVAWAVATDPDPLHPGQFHASGIPWAIAALAGAAVGTAIAVAVERTVIRRLRNAPPTAALLATFAAGQLITLLTYLLWIRGRVAEGTRILPPPFHAAIRIGSIRLLGEHLVTLAVLPALMVALALFFLRTRAGISIRAAADHPANAELAGISTTRTSLMTWAIGGALAALGGIFLAGMQRSVSLDVVGLGLLTRGLTAAVIGGMTSLPGAVAGGLGVGIAEAFLTRATNEPGLVEAALFAAVVAVLLASRRRGPEPAAPPYLQMTARRAAVPARRIAFVLALVAAIGVVPQLLGPSGNFTVSLVLVYAIVGVSLNLLMGDAGLISLGHFAFAGIGAFAGAKLVADAHVPYALAVAFATLCGAAVAFIIALPAVRLKGLGFALATFTFAVAAEGYLFRLSWFGSLSGISFPRPRIFGADLAAPSGAAFTTLCAVALIGVATATRNVQRRRSGRAMRATRDNETAAATFGVPVAGYRVLAFTLSGGLAALAGTLYGMLAPPVHYAAFEPFRSLELVAMVVIGGLGSVAGAVMGAAYVVGIQRAFAGSPAAGMAAIGLGTLGVLLYRPSGLWGFVRELAPIPQTRRGGPEFNHPASMSHRAGRDHRSHPR
jgi:sulfate-transporting ATPase